ncbi:MAG: DUF4870 domain-containing protein [Planctomycetota bacterium]
MNDEHPHQTPADPNSNGPGSTPPPSAGDASGIPKDQRTWGFLAHLTALSGVIGIPFGQIIGPLVIWLIKKDEMPFVDEHGRESLNFQITVTIVLFALGVLSIIPFVICLTLPLFATALIVDIVFVIMATIAANEGRPYRYPMTARFL